MAKPRKCETLVVDTVIISLSLFSLCFSRNGLHFNWISSEDETVPLAGIYRFRANAWFRFWHLEQESEQKIVWLSWHLLNGLGIPDTIYDRKVKIRSQPMNNLFDRWKSEWVATVVLMCKKHRVIHSHSLLNVSSFQSVCKVKRNR